MSDLLIQELNIMKRKNNTTQRAAFLCAREGGSMKPCPKCGYPNPMAGISQDKVYVKCGVIRPCGYKIYASHAMKTNEYTVEDYAALDKLKRKWNNDR